MLSFGKELSKRYRAEHVTTKRVSSIAYDRDIGIVGTNPLVMIFQGLEIQFIETTAQLFNTRHQNASSDQCDGFGGRFGTVCL
jgi:hypothetical protein